MSTEDNLPEPTPDEDSFVILNEPGVFGDTDDGNFPEPSDISMQIATSILNENDPQGEVARILEQNKILQDLLKKNNISIKSQCETLHIMQSDIIKTIESKKNVIIETKTQIEDLKNENVRLKTELEALIISTKEELDKRMHVPETTKEIDDTIDKLSKQLALVEKERRLTIEENEKLKWQNESLNTLVKTNGEQLDNKSMEFVKIKKGCDEELMKKNLEILELKNKLKESYQIALQPVASDITVEKECNPENFSKFVLNLKEFNKNIKDLATVLNQFLNDQSSLMDNSSTMVMKLQNSNPPENIDSIKAHLDALKKLADEHQSKIPTRIQNLKKTLACVETIFVDYQNVLKSLNDKVNKESVSIKEFENSIADAKVQLLDKDEELKKTVEEINELKTKLEQESDSKELLKLQLEGFKNDFELERKSRTDIADEKVSLINQLRNLQLLNQQLMENQNDPSKSSQNRSSSPDLQDMEIIDKPIVCCPLCDKEFTSATKLQDHVYLCLDQSTQ